MSDHDDKNSPSNANSGLETGKSVIADFRATSPYHHEFADRFNDLSAEGKLNFNAATKVGDARLERTERDQRRTRRFRELYAENRRFREVLTNPDLKLGDVPFNGRAEIGHIEQMAKESVELSDQKNIERIREETRYLIEQEFADDAKRQEYGPEPTQINQREQDLDHDQDR